MLQHVLHVAERLNQHCKLKSILLAQLGELDDLRLTVAIGWANTLQNARERKHVLKLDQESSDRVSEIRCDELY